MALLLLFLDVWALAIPQKEVIREVGFGCVARVVAKAPLLFLDGQEYVLKDDGVGADEIAFDGVFSMFTPTLSEKDAQVKLVGDSGTVLWSGEVPFPPSGQQTWMIIDEQKEGERPIVRVEFQPVSGSSVGIMRDRESITWFSVWVSLVIGLGLGWRLRRPISSRIHRLYPSKKQKESAQRKQQVWSYREEYEINKILLEVGVGRQILLCTDIQRHPLFMKVAEDIPLFVTNWEENCAPQELYEQLFILESIGETLLVLDGLNGLIEPIHSEKKTAVLEEILQNKAHDILVLFAHDAVPEGISISQERNTEPTK
jgi:hypothetical protein